MLLPKKKWRKGAKPKTITDQKKSLDRLFSIYIRLRDADMFGYCTCITCHRRFFWKRGDAGHFVKRDRTSLRYNEKNVNAQCHYCNRMKDGEEWKHGEAIDKKFGKGTAKQLKLLGDMRGFKVDPYYFGYKIDEYKSKVKTIKKKKGFKSWVEA